MTIHVFIGLETDKSMLLGSTEKEILNSGSGCGGINGGQGAGRSGTGGRIAEAAFAGY